MYDFTAIDFETANNYLNSACSVGLVAVNDLAVVKQDYFLIKPPTDHFRPENIEIHGICFDDVRECDTFPHAYNCIKEYIENSRYLIAHNAQFDMSVLHACLTYYNLSLPNFTYIDSVNFSSKVRKNCGNSLSDCASYFSIEIKDHHNALADALTCAQIINASVNASRYRTFDSYLSRYSSIHEKSFCELKPQKSLKGFRNFSNVKISEISATVENFDAMHPLYNKNCVFTGELQRISRKSAMQLVADAGGILKSSVSSKTDYLIVGTQDKEIVGENGLSSKEETAHSLIAKGNNIKILSENDFLNMFNNQ